MLLLDTCTLLWLVAKQKELSAVAHRAISDNKENLFISAVSALELGIKVNKKLLKFPLPLTEWLQSAIEFHGIIELPVNSAIAVLSTELPNIHRDPADRLLIATALKHELTIMTPYQHICAYPKVKTLW